MTKTIKILPKEKKFLLFFIFIAIFCIFGLSFEKESKAAATDNVSLWAWSENIGWISMNCTNQASCASSGNYGVNIDPATGNMSGYGWSENIGWISFNVTSGCPFAPCRPNYSSSTKQISGGARACAVFQSGCSGALDSNRGNWDGWIRLRDTNYGVSIDTDPVPNEFLDFAWSDLVTGWISFNCRNTSGTSVTFPVAMQNWDYRVPVTLTSASALTDYQILITADTASAIASGKMKADCSDIRIADSDETTLRNFWIASNSCNTANTEIWVKIPSIPAGSKTLYMYYGNSLAGGVSDGDAVFLLFNDFEPDPQGNRGNWQVLKDAHWSAQSTSTYFVSPDYSYLFTHDSGVTSTARHALYYTTSSFPAGMTIMVEAEVKDSIAAGSIPLGSYEKRLYFRPGGYLMSSGSRVLHEEDPASDGISWEHWAYSTTTIATSSYQLFIKAYNYTFTVPVTSYGFDNWWDDVRVRKYTGGAEPSFAFGSEESGAAGGGCTGSDYKVIVTLNNPPDPPSSLVNATDYCVFANNFSITFGWAYFDPNGDLQKAYQFQLDDDSDFSSPVASTTVSGVSTGYARSPANLSWGRTYYWRVRTEDINDNWSGWSSTSFNTIAHDAPYVDFGFSPPQPTIGEVVTFIQDTAPNESLCYGGQPLCQNDGNVSYVWDFKGDGSSISTFPGNVTTTYSQKGTYNVGLRITDGTIGIPCSNTTTISIISGLPWWREISPF